MKIQRKSEKDYTRPRKRGPYDSYSDLYDELKDELKKIPDDEFLSVEFDTTEEATRFSRAMRERIKYHHLNLILSRKEAIVELWRYI